MNEKTDVRDDPYWIIAGEVWGQRDRLCARHVDANVVYVDSETRRDVLLSPNYARQHCLNTGGSEKLHGLSMVEVRLPAGVTGRYIHVAHNPNLGGL